MRAINPARLLWLVVMLALLRSVEGLGQSPDRVSVAFHEKSKLTVLRGGQEYMTVDLEPFTTMGEALLGRDRPRLRPVSPDGRYVPVLIMLGKGHGDLLLVDLGERRIERCILCKEEFPSRVREVEWITSRTLGVRGPWSFTYIVYDILARRVKILKAEEFLTWDSEGENYASIFGKIEWFERTPPPGIAPEKLLVSEALRYNSFWVYPEPLKGFTTRDEYLNWTKDISVRESGRGAQQPPIIRTRGVALAHNHVLSVPTFIGDTSWVGFFEQVFPLQTFEEIREANVVILDGSRVHSNPPDPAELMVKKRSVPSIAPTTKEEYINLATNLFTKWNPATSCLELWQTEGWWTKEKTRNLGRVPIDLSRMELGGYVPVQGDWISVGSASLGDAVQR